MASFEANGSEYEIVFSIKRIEQYEASHRPVMASFAQNSGTFSIGELKGLLAYGMKKVDGGWVGPEQGMRMAGEIIEANGYMAVHQTIIEALKRDCGFFFAGTE